MPSRNVVCCLDPCKACLSLSIKPLLFKIQGKLEYSQNHNLERYFTEPSLLRSWVRGDCLTEIRVLVDDCVVSDQIQSSVVSVGMLGSPVRDHHEKDKMPFCPPALCCVTLKTRGSLGSFCVISRTNHRICKDRSSISAAFKEEKCNFKVASSTQEKRKGNSNLL